MEDSHGSNVLDLGEAWGFCPAPGRPRPLPSAGYDDDPAQLAALARAPSLAEVAAMHPGCAQVPPLFDHCLTTA